MPFPNGLLQILPLLFSSSIGIRFHVVIAFYSHLADFRQVTVLLNQGVQPWNKARRLQFLYLLRTLLVQPVERTQQGCSTVTRLFIILAHHIIMVRLHAKHAQQVMIEYLAVGTLLNKRHIAICPDGCKHGGISHGLILILACYLLGIISQVPVLLIDNAQYSLKYCTQGSILDGLLALLQTFHFRFQ